MTEPLADEPAREAIREDLDSTFVVEAAAGTGKTTALVSRIIEVVRSGRGELARLAAVTFTEKAAGELKLRLRGKLEEVRSASRAAGDDEVTARLERGLAQLEEAHIGTIHGFCADLLKQRPLQAGVDPLFEVATEDETERIYRRVFDRWLEETLGDPPPGVRRLVRRQARYDEGPVDELYGAGRTLIELRDFPTPWQIRPFDREDAIDSLVDRAMKLAEKAAQAESPRDYLYMDFSDLIAFAQDLKGQEQVSGRRDYDALENRLPSVKLKGRKGRGPYADGIAREDLIEERDLLLRDVSELNQKARADLAAHLQNELQGLVKRYESLKERRGLLDFLDLLVRARDLLKHDAGVRNELQQSFTHIFVDEFQDTDPLQAEILLLLAADDPGVADWRNARPVPGKLFIVADPKQSIYRFRRADVALYQRVKRQLILAGAKPLYLTASFRSVPELQELVNTAMKAAMRPTTDNHQADYVPLHPYRSSIPGQPAIIALPIPRPYGDWGYLNQYAMQRSEPAAVASWVRWLLEESGWKVSARGEREARPVEASDVCLLFRRFISFGRPVTQPYVEALSGLDVPHVLVGGRGFHQREEVDALRVALTAVERPDDELSVFSTLRGPLFSLPDEALFLFRSRHGSLHPSRAVRSPLEGEDAAVRSALDVLARLHKERNRRPIALTIRELLDSTRAQAGFALWQSGDQVLANVLRVVQLARTFEEKGGLSFRGFVDRLTRLADVKDRVEQPVIEDGVEGVRLMTVHKAKGLEFPVVVLCDVTCPFSKGASRHVDPDRKIFAVKLAGGSPWELLDHEESEAARDRAESLRLLYVAATRARDVLVIPVVADEPHQRGWVGPLLPSLYPPERAHRLPMVPVGCPRFHGEDTVIERPARAPRQSGIRPGLHKSEHGGHGVVWWDPELFEIATDTKPGLRRHWILQADSGDDPGVGAREYAEWERRRARILETASPPSRRVTSVTRLVETETTDVEGAADVAVLTIEGRDPHRPTGKRFGTLAHEVLARSPLSADAAEVASIASSLGRLFGNTEAEIAAAADAVSAALRHPLLKRARQAPHLHRETPLVRREDDGRLVEGVPDLVFRDDAESPWTVVDFKTDLRPDMAQSAHRRQVALYRLALQEATRIPAVGCILYI
jgi:ATP-dependent helicase/nuclease subunit A